MATLPTLGASSTNVFAAGYSAGGYMTAQLMTVWPDLVRCGGMLNGGFTNTQMARKTEYNSATTEEQHEANYQETVRLLGAWATAGSIGDQSLLANNAMYIFSGANDIVVPPVTTLEAKRYFEEQGATVDYTLDADQGHWYNVATAAGDIGAFCNTSLETGVTQNAYTYEAGSTTFTDSGSWRKFDQQVFAAANDITETPELRQWGFYYIPSGCLASDSSCQFQLVMHGNGMKAEDMGIIFAPYAEANNVVMVFPQAIGGWNAAGTVDSEASDDNQYTKTGRINRFMRALIDTATSARGDSFTSDVAEGVYTFGTAYPAGTWAEDEGGEDKGGKDDWTYEDGVWTNSSTGETWSGDKDGGEKNPGDKEGWGDKGDKDGGEKSGWDPKSWADKDWGSKDGAKDESKGASGAKNGTCDLEGVDKACSAGLCCGTYEGKDDELCGSGTDGHTCSAFKLMASVGSVLAAAYLL